jgi:hypothetical protein
LQLRHDDEEEEETDGLRAFGCGVPTGCFSAAAAAQAL